MITMNKVCKTFRVARRNSGFQEAAKALFHREYEQIRALDDVTFTIADGEIVGYIGPNGAGKSSTIKVMSGILTPDSGECLINGRVPWKDRLNHVKNIGVVFGQRSQLWWDVPVIDSFQLLKEIYKIDEYTYRDSLEELITLLQIESVVKTPVRQLSLGQRMRCEIAAALLHRPEILFLDEPTIGLDAVSKQSVRKFIQKINQERKTTILLTTHDMQDIEALAKRILLIGKGRILLDGNLNDLKKRHSSQKKVTVEYSKGKILLQDGMTLCKEEEGRAVLNVNSDILQISGAVGLLSDQLEITDISISSISAEELVVSLYEEHHI